MKHPVFGNTVNGEACANLKNFLEEHMEKGNKKITLAVFDDLWIGLQQLWENATTETISDNAKIIYEKMGFSVFPCGIGWKVE